jgi:hypothetical protein
MSAHNGVRLHSHSYSIGVNSIYVDKDINRYMYVMYGHVYHWEMSLTPSASLDLQLNDLTVNLKL